jgi:hypothetical protein
MKNILFISPASYPVNGAEHIVNINLVKVLSEAGFKIDLISKHSKSGKYQSPTFDSFGLNINSIHVVEVENRLSLYSIYQHIMSFIVFGVGYRGCHWAIKALPIVNKLVKKNDYDYVLTKNAPGELLGYYLKKKYALKWIATWNDPYPSYRYPAPYGRGIHAPTPFLSRKLIPIMKEYVDVHVFPAKRLRHYINQYLQIKIHNTEIVPHVIIQDYTINKYAPSSKTLRMIHSGNVSSPRDPVPLLLAIQKVIRNIKDIHIHVTFLGEENDTLFKKVKELHLEQYIDILAPVDYLTSIKVLSDFDIAIIIEAPCEEGIFLPTKVSDYLQKEKPIFAISPKVGVLNDLHKENSIPYFADCKDLNSIENELNKIYEDFIHNMIQPIRIHETYMQEHIVKQYDKF